MNTLHSWQAYRALQEEILSLLEQSQPDLGCIEERLKQLNDKQVSLAQVPPADSSADEITQGLELISATRDNNQKIQTRINELRLYLLKNEHVNQSQDHRFKQTLGAYHQNEPSAPRFIDRHR